MASIDRRLLKAFVRYDKQGRVVAGSLIKRRGMPKVGIWREIAAHLCCNPTDPNCIEYSLTIGSETINLWYTACDTTLVGPISIAGPLVTSFCARRGTVAITGDAIVAEIGLCENSTSTTTTTTTATPTTTTTTTERGVTTTTTTTVEGG